MRQILINYLKYNKVFYFIYYYLMSFFINVLKLFVRPNKHLILFNSFAGRKYDDSPREIYELMKKDPRFSNYRLVWAFHNPEKYECVDKIKTDGLKYFVYALSARVWITNSSFERGLNFKGKNTFYLNTWHGTPIKLMGTDIKVSNKSFKQKANNKTDIMMSQSKYETEIFSRSFGIPQNRFLEAGLPRNDIIANHSEKQRQQIRDSLGIDSSKTVILYCPTFREYEKDQNNGCVLTPPLDLSKWKTVLGEDWVLLFRAHYEVAKVMNLASDNFCRDMTGYPNINDLIIASDILISDYSSVFFDYSITDKPMLHFAYDYEKYNSERGMYFDIRDYLAGGASEEEILSILKESEYDNLIDNTVNFKNKFVEFYGNATKSAVDCVAKELNI